MLEQEQNFVGNISTLADHHKLVTEKRDTGNGYRLSARKYPTGDVEVTSIKFIPDDNFRRAGGHIRKNTKKIQMDEKTLSKSVRRARTVVRRKCLTFQPDRMLTTTFRENITDINEAWEVMHYFHKLMRETFGEEYQYIAVPEYQKRGAVHFHLAIKGFYPVKVVRKLWLRAVGKRGGNIDITSPKNFNKNSWNPKRIASYLSKYITKTESVEFNRRRYASGGKIVIPSPMLGWIACGLPILGVMRQILESLTTFEVATVWESEEYFSINYIST